MAKEQVSRRNFSKLATAAVGGILVGSRAASAQEKKGGAATKNEFPVDASLLLQDPNVCRGLNSCDGKGKGDHKCAGQSSCSTVAKHSCNGMNECKGQGGCDQYPGQNTCKELGHCGVPLKKETWDIARKQFEQLMKDTGQKVGAAPAA